MGELLLDSTCCLEAPYVLGSVAHFEVATEYKARKLVSELRKVWADKEMQLGGRRYALRMSVMKTRTEMERNQRLMELAQLTQQLLVDGHPDKQRQPSQGRRRRDQPPRRVGQKDAEAILRKSVRL